MRVSERLKVPHVASGNLFREAVGAGTPLGIEAQRYMNRGDLVPDDITIGIVAERLGRPDAESFVLDGFPRTRHQAEALDDILEKAQRPLDLVIFLDVREDELTQRLTRRRMCPKCQRTYNMTSNPPKSDEVCDEDGSKLIVRTDDDLEAVLRRFDVYHRETEELVDYYKNRGLLVRVDGLGSVDEVAQRLDEAIAGGP
jgi:adenylate kinase